MTSLLLFLLGITARLLEKDATRARLLSLLSSSLGVRVLSVLQDR